MSYVLEYHNSEFTLMMIESKGSGKSVLDYWENMPAMESISRCKRKLALKDEIFRPTNKKVIESRINQTKNILEEARKTWPYE